MAEKIVVVDYGSGNLRSVAKALERAASELTVERDIAVTSDPAAVETAARLVLPGVGAFSACMSGLQATDGLIPAIEHHALVEKRPFLGICVGMQLLAHEGLEYGRHEGLSWIAGSVAPIAGSEARRVPHMGWNTVRSEGSHPLLKGLDGEAFYFAHSYHFDVENNQHQIGVTVYGDELTAAVARDNIAGFQFHPEKSQGPGIAALKNFLMWEPA